MSETPQSIVDAANSYVDARNKVEELENELAFWKDKLDYREQVFVEQCGQHNVKNYRHADGLVGLARDVFGSIKKEYDKETVLAGMKELPEYADLIVAKDDFNAKHLGSRIRDKEIVARAKWLAENAGVEKPKPFTADLYLPPFLIEVLNVSEGFGVRFTRTKENKVKKSKDGKETRSK